MRRTFRRRSFRRGPPVKRQQRNWQTSVFTTTTLTTDATLVELIVFDPQNLMPVGSNPLGYAKKTDVRRLVGNFVVGIRPLNASAEVGFARYIWAMYVIDRDETVDITLLTTTGGEILEGGVRRVLQTGVFGQVVYEANAAAGVSQAYPSVTFGYDVKLGMQLHQDEVVAVGLQACTNLSTFIDLPIVSGVHRTLLVD